jgi:ADP-ribose pyrophosphatase
MKRNGHWEIKSSEVKYRNDWISVREDEILRPSGATDKFNVVTMTPGVTALALDHEGFAYLIREHRYAIERYSVEASSGGIEPGESPLQAAKRELKEETGLSSSKWTDLGAVDPFTAIIDSRDHMFLAEDVLQGERNLEADERIEVVKIPFEAAVEMVVSGEITHGASAVAILKTKIMRERLE